MIPAGAVVGLQAKRALWRQTALRSTRPLCSAGQSFTLPAPIEAIISKLSEGATQADMLHACPRLTREDTKAALMYSADALANQSLCHNDPNECLVSEEDREPLRSFEVWLKGERYGSTTD